MLGLTQFMRDIHGIVHELMGNGVSWTWPTGHGDPTLRQATPVYQDPVVSCFRCMEEHRKYQEFLRKTGR